MIVSIGSRSALVFFLIVAPVLVAACGGRSGPLAGTGGQPGADASAGTGGADGGGGGGSGSGGAAGAPPGSGGALGSGGSSRGSGGSGGTPGSGGRVGGSGGAPGTGGTAGRRLTNSCGAAAAACPQAEPAVGTSCQPIDACCFYGNVIMGISCPAGAWQSDPPCACVGTSGTGGAAGGSGGAGSGPGDGGAPDGAVIFGSCRRDDPSSCPAGYRCACGGGGVGQCQCHRECQTSAECGRPDLTCGCGGPVGGAGLCVDGCFCNCDG
jgi:hypothetical protein